MKFKDYNKYLIAAFFLAIIVLSFLIIRPFIGVITISLLLGYVFRPLYTRFTRIVKNKHFSALIVSLLIIFIIMVPLIFLLNSLAKETNVFYVVVKQKLLTENIITEETPGLVYTISDKWKDIVSDPQFKYYVGDTTKRLTTKLTETISRFVFTIPKRILDLFIMLLMLFYIFKDGGIMADRIKKLIPLNQKQTDHLINKFKGMTHAVIFGYLLIAILEGILGGLILYILRIPNPILWGFVIGFLSLLPFIGPPIVWIPASVFLIINGVTTNSNIIIVKGLILIFYGLFILTPIDNIMKPRIIGRRAKVHPVGVLIGVLGGIYFFGLVGLILGPLILAMLVAFVELYEQEKL